MCFLLSGEKMTQLSLWLPGWVGCIYRALFQCWCRVQRVHRWSLVVSLNTAVWHFCNSQFAPQGREVWKYLNLSNIIKPSLKFCIYFLFCFCVLTCDFANQKVSFCQIFPVLQFVKDFYAEGLSCSLVADLQPSEGSLYLFYLQSLIAVMLSSHGYTL